jgi:hypothetical protein
MRDHIKKAPPRREPFDVNEAINEVIVLVRSIIVNTRVSVRIRLMEVLHLQLGANGESSQARIIALGGIDFAQPGRMFFQQSNGKAQRLCLLLLGTTSEPIALTFCIALLRAFSI